MRISISILTIVSLSLALAITHAHAAQPTGPQLEAEVGRSDIALGESFVLRLRLSGNGSDTPELLPLETDFHVLDVQQLARTVIVNGTLEQYREWRVQLSPRRAGAVEVPAIGLRASTAAASDPIPIDVAANGEAVPSHPLESITSGDNPSIFVEASVDDASPYVQAQVLLHVRIHSEASLLSGRLADPQAAGASVERVGEDKSYERTIGGRRYRVIEREFAIFPQQSGALVIPPIAFEGRLPDAAATLNRGIGRMPRPSGFGGSLFDDLEAMMGGDFFGPRGRSVRLQSDAVTMNVRPRPQDADGRWWLPATALDVVEEWDGEPDVIEMGDQLTRSLTIRALGVSREQLPELELPDVAGLKQYREPVVDETVRMRDGVASVKSQKTVLIPAAPGEYVLPAVELEWWDTNEDSAKVARVPERRILVVAGDDQIAAAAIPSGSSSEPPPNTVAPSLQESAMVTETEPGLGGGVATWGKNEAHRVWMGIAGGALALFSLFYLRRRRGTRSEGDGRAGVSIAGSARRRQKHAERMLEHACRANDPSAAAQALTALAGALWSDAKITNPCVFAERYANVEVARAIEGLNRARFAPDDATVWIGESLWSAYRRSRRTTTDRPAPPRSEVLPALYPQTGNAGR
jgi:hypothetical protein